MPDKDEVELIADPNGRFTFGSTGKNGHDNIEEVLNIHYEAIKDLEILPFEQANWDTKWAYCFQEFGANDFMVMQENGYKYFLKFFETVCIKGGPAYFKDQQKSGKGEKVESIGSWEIMRVSEKHKQKQADSQSKTSNHGGNSIRVILRINDGSIVRTLYDGQVVHTNENRGNLN